MAGGPAGPVLRYSHVGQLPDGSPVAVVVIGWAADLDAAWEAVAVDAKQLRRWRRHIDAALRALGEE